MLCPKRTSVWFPFHRWDKGVIHYPPMLSDGAGGCWCGELIETCIQCGKEHSRGVYARDEENRWSWMGPARGGNSIVKRRDHF